MFYVKTESWIALLKSDQSKCFSTVSMQFVPYDDSVVGTMTKSDLMWYLEDFIFNRGEYTINDVIFAKVITEKRLEIEA